MTKRNLASLDTTRLLTRAPHIRDCSWHDDRNGTHRGARVSKRVARSRNER